MRIRKRPSSSFPFVTSLPLSPDPSLPVHPPNGRHGTKDSCERGPVEEEGLHPVGDLPIDPHEFGENPNRRSIQDPFHSDPYSDAKGRRRRSSSVQVLKEVKEEEEGTVDSNKRWNAQVSSSKRLSGSSGAVAAGATRLKEMVSPQKKTRGGDDNGNGDGGSEDKLMEQEKKAKAKGRASTGPASANNNCTSIKDSDKEGCDGGVAVARAGNGNGPNGNGKRRRSPAVLMEGSRCSRVNGRGWRCCQQTLVGYSLCEHHLGKGRLRSMSSVRGHLGTSKPRWSTDGRNGVVPSTSPQEQEEEEEKKQRQQSAVAADNGVDKVEDEEEEEEEEEDNDENMAKKKKKIGLVKARSISSLLDDTNHPVLSMLSQAPEIALLPPPHGNEASTVS